ncbi:MAG: nitrite/sulfite reductase [Methylococcaceae bacterium]
MYQYNHNDQILIEERVAQFRRQTEQFLKGEISEDGYRALRLRNGVYIQTHAPMLRVAVPYGVLNSKQLHKLAHIARTYDKDYCHITTRQNVQFNWPKLEQIPDILAELAEVQMHAIQTSGNCMRNTTSDHLAGVGIDEIEDPRPYCELIRQWTTLHPEFDYLPRKFKMAVSGSSTDRAATQFHDIGLHLVKNDAGEIGFKVLVGGGLGRTPVIGQVIKPFLDKKHILSYLEATLRIYNLFGRRDNKYKARIKILVRETGLEEFSKLVDAEWALIRDGLEVSDARFDAMKAHFKPLHYDKKAAENITFSRYKKENKVFETWVKYNTLEHKIDGYRVVFLSLKAPDTPPGDLTAEQLDTIAKLAEIYSFGEVRSTHRQNLVFADVKQADLFQLWQLLSAAKLTTPNIGTATDMICCPGLDFCSLANAGSIGIAKEINELLDNLDYLHDIGDVNINMSGCMNGCAHQSVGHIGILGVDKKGVEWYQLTLGGSSANEAAIGERLGRAVPKNEVTQAVGTILEVYIQQRLEEESFLDTVKRVGMEPFQEKVYASH